MSHTLFISDLHLDQSAPKVTAAFFHFLKHDAPKADALYILGDFFELWVGDDDRTEFNQGIIKRLAEFCESGIPVYLMHGNRDFLIGKKFLQSCGVTLIKDPTIINLYGERIYLTHGDSLCTLDIKHQKFRKLTGNRFYRAAALKFPLSMRRKYGRVFREKSKQQNRINANEIIDVAEEEVQRVMAEHEVQKMIHGHTHRPNIHQIQINHQPATRIVLGAWYSAGNLLRHCDDGQYSLEALPFKEIAV